MSAARRQRPCREKAVRRRTESGCRAFLPRLGSELMYSAPDQPSPEPPRRFLSRRAAPLSLVIALHVLMALVALRPVGAPHVPVGPRSITIKLLPESQKRTLTVAPRRPTETSRQTPAPATLAEHVDAPTPVADIWSQVIPLTREEFAAANIARTAPRAASPAPESENASSAVGDDNRPAEQLGAGPAGEQLYNAEWHREPTRTELAYYVPAGAPRIGWGMIACQTVKDYRVEDCREIAQFPPGSGLARAVLQAAWQFRVRPPRIGGRSLVGAWVRIRIDYSEVKT